MAIRDERRRRAGAPDATDQLGLVQRIDAGPPLGAVAFEVIVWVCSHWRERGEPRERPRPLHPRGDGRRPRLAKGGSAAAEIARVLDALRLATFRARVYDARVGETRIDTFGLLDRWERGERHRSGRPARPGFVALGGLAPRAAGARPCHLRELGRAAGVRAGTARRLLVCFDAEPVRRGGGWSTARC